IVAAPAMRIAVLVLVIGEQCAAFREQLYDDGIRGENILALVLRQTLEVHAAIIDGRVNLQPVFLAGVEVIGAVSRSGVHDSAALIESDVVGENAGHLNRQKRMLKSHPGKVGTFELSPNAGYLDSRFRLQGRNAIRRE